jgi:hypothetical protein
MKNWIMNFIADERGAESTELGVSALVVGGGAIVQRSSDQRVTLDRPRLGPGSISFGAMRGRITHRRR